MEIIKLPEPWCFFASEEVMTIGELEELQSYFVNDKNLGCRWQIEEWNGINQHGASDWHNEVKFFAENSNEEEVWEYSVNELREIIAKHKEPQLEEGVVYHSVYGELNYLFVNEKEWINLSSKMFYSGGMSWENMHESPTHVMTKATPAQIAHYEACVKAGKYVEPEEELEKWSIGTYIVVVRKDAGILLSKHTVAKIHNHTADCVHVNEDVISKQREDDGSIKWFPTLQEAEEFAKTLKEPVVYEKPAEPQKYIVGCDPATGHTELTNNSTFKSERYIKTMEFFEQLREPERSEAIANYDEEFSKDIPKDLFDALNYAFSWSKSLQEAEYWMNISDKIELNTYFNEPELLVFGKYKIGDIVVLNYSKGPMFKVSKKSTSDRLVDTDDAWSESPENFRLATPEEVEAYNQGVRNIADIKFKPMKRAVKFNSEEERRHILAHYNPLRLGLSGVTHGWILLNGNGWSFGWGCLEKDGYTELSFEDWCKEFNHPFKVEKEAVHCTTQKEWNFALSKFNPRNISNNYFRDGQHCINTISPNSQGCVGSLSYYKELNFTILTFKQWCEKYGHTYEVVPEYVECISSTESHYYKVGKVYTWPDTITEQGKHNKPNVLKGSIWKFKPSTKEAYDKQQKKLKMEELLSEAKLKFPIGTKFKCYVSRSVVHEVKDLSLFVINSGHIFYEHQMVYNGTIWAEIVKEEPKVTEIKPAKGMYVRCLKQNTWGDGKTEVGQVLKIEDVSSYGDMWVNNQSLAIQRIQRREFELLPDYKEEPWVAQVGDWVYITEGEKYGSDLKTGAVVQCTEWESDSQQFGKNLSTWTCPKHYRKATQAEIDSVTKTTEGLGLPKIPISDFIPVKQGVGMLEQISQQQDYSVLTPEKVARVFEPQQDELVIYKPKRLIL